VGDDISASMHLSTRAILLGGPWCFAAQARRETSRRPKTHNGRLALQCPTPARQAHAASRLASAGTGDGDNDPSWRNLMERRAPVARG
jgi:hypothetical protein